MNARVLAHQPFRQHVEDRAGGVGDHVERELRPLERPVVGDRAVSVGRPVAPKAAKSQLCVLADPTGANAIPPRFAATHRPAAVVDADGTVSATATIVVGAERGRELLLVADAVLRRDDRGRRTARQRAPQRLDRRGRVVRLHRDQRQIGGHRLDRGQVARRVGHVVADPAQQLAEIRSDRPPPDDVDLHPAVIVPGAAGTPCPLLRPFRRVRSPPAPGPRRTRPHHRRDDQLRDAIAAAHDERLAAQVLPRDHADLTAVVAVDRPGAVEARSRRAAAPAAARADLHLVARRDLQRNPVGTSARSPGRSTSSSRDRGDDVGSGRAVAHVGGQR